MTKLEALTELVDVDLLRRLLKYCPDTGKLYWLPRVPEMFNNGTMTSLQACDMWNRKNAGKEAFTASNSEGYKHGTIFKKSYKAHRVAFALFHNHWPSGEVDHINGSRTDNRIENLRDVSMPENMKNKSRYSNSTSGFPGVSFHKGIGKWVSYITIGGKRVHVGTFQNKKDAIAARADAERAAGFHENHGRYLGDNDRAQAMQDLVDVDRDLP